MGLDVEKFGKVGRCSTIDGTVTDACYFIFDACLNREPVQGAKVRGDVVRTGNFEHKTSGRVLKFLKSLQEAFRTLEKQAVTIIKA